MAKTLLPSVVLLLLTALILPGCLDKSDHYKTLNEARAAQVFVKGWLPDLLPASTHKLKVVTSVEVSAGRGEFMFDAKDYGAFASKLQAYNGARSTIESDNRSIKSLLEEGYEARTYSTASTNWIFLFDPDRKRCQFFVWQGHS